MRRSLSRWSGNPLVASSARVVFPRPSIASALANRGFFSATRTHAPTHVTIFSSSSIAALCTHTRSHVTASSNSANTPSSPFPDSGGIQFSAADLKRPSNLFVYLTNQEIPLVVKAPSYELRTDKLKYPLQDLPPSDKPSGYLPPLGNTGHLPFRFVRTQNETLPVYTKLKNKRTKLVTILNQYRGDVQELEDEVRRLLGDDVEIRRRAGSLEMKGDHRWALQMWLKRLGF